MLVNAVLSRHLRDGKAIARYAGLTGSPDRSGRGGPKPRDKCATNRLIVWIWRALRSPI
jgi:transposase